MEKSNQPQQHFLVLAYPEHGHINPAIHLANRLVRSAGVRVTFCTAVSARYRNILPAIPTSNMVTFALFDDGHDKGFTSDTDAGYYMRQFELASSETLSSLLRRRDHRNASAAAACVIYSFLTPWVARLAIDHGVPSAVYWIQPATVFAIYYHYFHGYGSLVAAHREDPLFPASFPGLPGLRIRDLPSFLTTPIAGTPLSAILDKFRETFEIFDLHKPKVLLNTSGELEPDALSAVGDALDLNLIGPMLPPPPPTSACESEEWYMEWLDSQAERSVVYVAFGSMAEVKGRQAEEIAKGLEEAGRPFLWVARDEGVVETTKTTTGGKGIVVRWCSQARVLAHPSVGCFVTHCGWNSMAESLVCGVPTVAVPGWADQRTIAMLTEKAWGTGVRVEVDGDGVVDAEELKRCLGIVMNGEEILNAAKRWRDRVRVAVGEGGSSDRNLRKFVEDIAKACTS